MGCIVSKLFLNFYIFFYIYKAPKAVYICIPMLPGLTEAVYGCITVLPGLPQLPIGAHSSTLRERLLRPAMATTDG